MSEQQIDELVASLVLIVAGLILAFFVARLFLHSIGEIGHRTTPPLVTAMTLMGSIGLFALIGALITQSESAFTIAATVVGALGGYVAAQAQIDKQHRDQQELDEGGEGDDDVQRL